MSYSLVFSNPFPGKITLSYKHIFLKLLHKQGHTLSYKHILLKFFTLARLIPSRGFIRSKQSSCGITTSPIKHCRIYTRPTSSSYCRQLLFTHLNTMWNVRKSMRWRIQWGHIEWDGIWLESRIDGTLHCAKMIPYSSIRWCDWG